MVSIWKSTVIRNVVIVLLLTPAIAVAAVFKLFWDPNCNEDNDLEGYYIYYLEEDSVIANPNDATEIYVPLLEYGFDPDVPQYQVSGLIDGVAYCFTVSASYRDEESSMSNEICGINGAFLPNYSPDSESSDGSFNVLSDGCFIDVLK